MSSQLKYHANPIMLLIISVAIAWYVGYHFHPGAMSPDSFSILSQARSGVFLDNHPPLLALIWRQIEAIVLGPIGMLIFNLSLFYGGLYLIFLQEIRAYPIAVFITVTIIGLYPPIIGILGAIWADITMAALFLFSIGLHVTVSRCAPINKPQKIILSIITNFFNPLLAFFFIFISIALRHNAAAAAYPLVVFFLMCGFDRTSEYLTIKRLKTMAIMAIALIALFFLAAKQISNWMVDTPSHFWRVAALYDIAGTSYHQQTDLFCPRTVKSSSLVAINILYTPRSVIPLLIGRQVHVLPVGSVEPEAPPIEFIDDTSRTNHAVFQCWISVITNYPLSYLKHRWEVYKSLTTRSPWGLWGAVYDWTIPNDLGIPEMAPRGSLYFDTVKTLAARSPIFIPIFYVCIGIVFFMPVLWLALSRKNSMLMLSAALYASATTHSVGLFFFAASADFRYSHWTITATMIATSLLLLEGCKSLGQKRRHSVASLN